MSELERPQWPASFDELVAMAQAIPADQRVAERAARDRQAQVDAQRRARAGWVEYARRVSDLGDRFAERTFANYRVPPGDAVALAEVREMLEDRSRAPWLYGAFGVGKSHLLAGSVNALIDRGIPAAFTTGAGLIDRIKASYDRGGNVRDGAHDIIGALVRIPFLVVDDLDKVVLTEWSAQRLYVLTNGRYEAKRGIAISTNLSPADLRNAWTARLRRREGTDDGDLLPSLIGSIYDRLLEMTRLVRVQGVSQRGIPA